MLRELTIKDFAIIESLDINFQSKMTAITGETGAGKSIVIDALGLLAGGRASQEFIRQSANKFILQGLFDLPSDQQLLELLQHLGINFDDHNIIIQREYSRNGHGICRINGLMVTRAVLRQVGKYLLDIHGQNEQQSLMHVESHIQLLDQFDPAIGPIKQNYQTAYNNYQKYLHQLQQRKKNEQSWAQRLDMLKFQVKEIKAADLKTNEENQLQHEKGTLENFQLIQQSLANSYQLLTGDPAASLDQVGKAMDSLEQISNFSKSFKKISDNLNSAFYLLQDTAHDLSNQLELLEWDEGRLEEVNERLELINQLEHKYGADIPEILDYYQKISNELQEMESSESDSDQLEQQVLQAHQAAEKIADHLRKLRHKAADKLVLAVHKQLKELCMDKAIFEPRFWSLNQLNQNGSDRVEFYIQTNPGETVGPLVKIASGGELSRVMLALKTIFSVQQNVTSIIFDEVDTGVGGRVAQAIAEKILQIAKQSQVLCITHLPQVAAVSDHQLLVRKQVVADRTETKVCWLTERQRIDELARMLAGSQITSLTKKHAAELLELAARLKGN
ncbi:DNA repair protein RecN [Liquorilactobacillus nagelii]|uniref:DNA repair protein RecN n=1 Tax=Liquorilactobacillus nagelii TaxID=82688 RepID=UPI0039ECBDF0